jgi:predicted PurR-regulated permease PerM
MRRRQGCLAGLLELFLLNQLFDWLQDRFGFGRGSCSGVGCGIVLVILFLILACVICGSTEWTSLRFF